MKSALTEWDEDEQEWIDIGEYDHDTGECDTDSGDEPDIPAAVGAGRSDHRPPGDRRQQHRLHRASGRAGASRAGRRRR